MNDFSYNNQKMSVYGIFLEDFPSIPAASRSFRQHDIPGDGAYLEDLKKYDSTKIKAKANYLGDWGEKWREAQRVLSATNAALIFEHDPKVFYKILRTELGANRAENGNVGRFEIDFITKDGLAYLREGTVWSNCQKMQYNPHIPCFPNFKISGSGECELSVNNNKLRFFCDGEILIDVEKEFVLKNNQIINSNSTGDISKLILKHGMNTIEYPDAFKIQIQPNWRMP